ncbi:MAG: FAD-binding oxidoreductase [Bacteroidetes bacterium]|nr:FAD-binding oxidoreductase [Bacteroidota bacterium]
MKLSFWELKTYFSNLDVVIIGSGIVGLFAALHLKKNSPKLKILVLERGVLPSGSSTKNAGFACFGSASEILDDLKNTSEKDVRNLMEKRFLGLQKLRSELGDKAIDFLPLGGYELFDKDAVFESCAEKLESLNKLTKSFTKVKNTYYIADKSISNFQFKNIKHLIFNSCEGQIDTGKMMQALLLKAHKSGIIILNGIKCQSILANEGKIILEEDMELKAAKILITTNGFAKELLPELNVEPARAQVLITKPIPGLPIKGTFHYEQGYYYFRNIGERLLFGGGRNLDFKGEETVNMGLTRQIQNHLERLLREKILPNHRFEVEHRWSGIMGVGKQKSPIIKQISPSVFCAVRMGGMGVAIGSLVGEEAANLLLES